MSYTKHIVIQCDLPGCIQAIRNNATSVPLSRRLSRRYGWTYTNAGGDRCDKHPYRKDPT